MGKKIKPGVVGAQFWELRVKQSAAEVVEEKVVRLALAEIPDFKGDAGVRCNRTAKGLCDTHHAAKLPPAKTRCTNSECKSGAPGVRKNKKVGRCQPCLDAMDVAAKRKAAEIPAVECPTRGKRPKR